MRLSLVTLVVVIAACSRQEVALSARVCGDTACTGGYACLNGVCRAIDDSGVASGETCSQVNAVAACDAAVNDCSHGCVVCDGSIWGSCIRDCAVLAPELAEPESCDGLDNDCDGLIDESDDPPAGCVDRYRDNDGDGFGVGKPRCACADDPTGFTATKDGDCNDDDASTFPGGVGSCASTSGASVVPEIAPVPYK